MSEQGKINMRESRRKNKIKYEKARINSIPKISGGNNYQSIYFIHTPWGIYETYRAAIIEARRLRKFHNKKDVISDITTLRKYCESCILLNPTGRRTVPEWRGKTTLELGFYKEKK